jgi:hypothetical protein
VTRPRLFIEAPAGLAAVSLRLHGGPNCRPPISRMGSKAGYAEVILAALGLRSGQGADAYLWAEADLDVAALLRCYPDADMLRRVAEIIRGWAGEEPRALWERLRAERKARGPRGDADVARWAALQGGTATDHGGKGRTAAGLGERFEGMAREVGATLFLQHGSFSGKGMEYGIGRPEGADRAGNMEGLRPSLDIVHDAVVRMANGWPPVAVLTRIPEPAEVAAMLGTPGDLSGVVVYMDPPYVGTTGYAHDLPRAEVLRLARAYAAMGATVAISEAEPLFELDGPEWRVVEITGGRKGQKRTFSKQRAEFVTMNREPAHRVATQSALFAAGAA